jgi:hypothetical protein
LQRFSNLAPLSLQELPRYLMDEVKDYIRIDPCHYIIQYDPKSSFESSLHVTDRKWFENIKKPEEEETNNDGEDCPGNPEHRNEETHHLIDDDPWIIGLLKVSLSIF